MDILKMAREVLEQENPQEKHYILEQISDVLEYHHSLKEAEVIEVVKTLLSAALQEENQYVRETFFSTIASAVPHHDLRNRIDWDGLVGILPSLGTCELEYVLDILGFSGQVRYLPVLEEYAHHADPEIREWADDAMENITSRIRHAADSQKAG